MKTTIPYTKDILFKSKIAEITSISLEHELKTENDEISGNFIISGDYKTHEISINKEEFSYKLPFSVEVTEDIDMATLDFDIKDFYYDIIGNDTLRVNIEFSVSAEEKPKEEPEVIAEEEDREEITFEETPEDIENTTLEEIKLPVELEEVEPEEVTEIEVEKEEEKEEERLDEEQKQTIIEAISNNNSEEDEYITYNVHIIREMETLESISQTYNIPVEVIKDYNNVENVTIGDKIIIPVLEDE